MKKFFIMIMALALMVSLTACGEAGTETETGSGAAADGKTYKVGICNYVDDASLNQIADNIQSELKAIGEKNGITFEIDYENCLGDTMVLNQIINNFQMDKVDIMVGIATPVAMAMQAATEDDQTPVVFAAVSDPVGTGLVESLETPGSNLTGTSDYLNTEAIMNIIMAYFGEDLSNKTVGLLYDMGQDSSTTPIREAKAFLDAKGVKYIEKTGSNLSEVSQAVNSLCNEKVDAIFTPTDNTIMTCEISIYETLAQNNIPHFAGADSFALNGAFLGYGVDYENLGQETGKMIADILMNDKDPATTPVLTFDNGKATICNQSGINCDKDAFAKAIEAYCTKVEFIDFAEDFED